MRGHAEYESSRSAARSPRSAWSALKPAPRRLESSGSDMSDCRCRCFSPRPDFKVTGFDIDEQEGRLTSRRAARTSSAFRPTRFRARASRASRRRPISRKLSEQDAIIMCVPTPLTEHREPDLSYVENTAKVGRAVDAGGPAGGAGEHDLSGHDGRVDDSGAGSRKHARAEGAEQGDAGRERRVLRRLLAGARRSGQRRPSRGATYRRSSAATNRSRRSWRRRCTRASSRARCASRRPAWRR